MLVSPATQFPGKIARRRSAYHFRNRKNQYEPWRTAQISTERRLEGERLLRWLQSQNPTSLWRVFRLDSAHPGISNLPQSKKNFGI